MSKFKKLTNGIERLEKKFGGRVLMEVPTSERNYTDYEEEMNEVIEGILELFGAEGMHLFLKKGNSAFQCNHDLELDDIINIYNTMTKRLIKIIPREVLASLNAAAATTPEDESSDRLTDRQMQVLAQALEAATTGLPQDIVDQIEKNMDRAMGGMKARKESKNDEDPLSELM